MKRWYRVMAAAPLVALVWGAPAARDVGGRAAWAQQSSPAAVGKAAPAFAIKDLSGKEQSLSAYRGKIVLLNFFASW